MADLPTPPAPSEKPKEKLSSGFNKMGEGISDFFSELTDLKKGQDKEGTIISIKKNMRMRGANAWLLMCSIMIASLGLDLNSPAVIIGAMLISPLMSPILGIGLAIGINDNNTLYISLQHFGVSIAIALITSTIYFFFTPFGELTNEIQARTSPTFLDACVAFFGGIAGIISGTRKDKSNAIPGVAIATALMPPLCVTGFGIANLIHSQIIDDRFQHIIQLDHTQIILNSLYLFFLNAVLVSLATFLIVRLLRFPFKAFQNEREKRRTQAIIFIFSLAFIIPSFYILRGVLEKINLDRELKIAIQDCFGKDRQIYVDGWSTFGDTTLLVKVYGSTITDEIPELEQKLKFSLPNYKTVEIIPTTEVDLKKIQSLEAQYSQVDSLISQMQTAPLREENRMVTELKNQIAKMESDSVIERNIEKSILALYPDYITKVSYYNHPVDTLNKKYPQLSIGWKNDRVIPKIEKRLVDFVKSSTQRSKVEVSYAKGQ